MVVEFFNEVQILVTVMLSSFSKWFSCKSWHDSTWVQIRLLVLYMNPWDSIAILIKISWGIYWPTLYLPNLSNSLLHQTIKMAYFIRSLIHSFLNVCCFELSWAATTLPANVNKLSKIVFMSKVLDSQSNDLQRLGKNKVGQ